jgi:hypothetical protein
MAMHAATTKTAKGFQVLGPYFFAGAEPLFRPAILEHCAALLIIATSLSRARLQTVRHIVRMNFVKKEMHEGMVQAAIWPSLECGVSGNFKVSLFGCRQFWVTTAFA